MGSGYNAPTTATVQKSIWNYCVGTKRQVNEACHGDGARGAGGMKIIMGSHLTITAKLSSDWGPPLNWGSHLGNLGLVGFFGEAPGHVQP